MSKILRATALILSPVAVLAMPVGGDVVTPPRKSAPAALAAKGCTVSDREAEDGKGEGRGEGRGADAAKDVCEMEINPASGAVLETKAQD